MKRITTVLAAILVLLTGVSADSIHQKYIQDWASTAVREMYRSGVPASITLAQGMLESRCGLSELAAKGNNHFGIKCHADWKGKSMKMDDDRKGECFRVYKTADESFRDHSDFLRYRDRYKFLFDYPITDYKAWAYGLKKAGYATDPAYPTKLIRIIEEYGLDKYDTSTQDDIEQIQTVKEKPAGNTPFTKEKNTHNKKAKKSQKKAAAAKHKAPPASPLAIEEAMPVRKEAAEKFSFSLSRQMMSKNGVTFIYAQDGETYESIAAANHLFYREILRFNDAMPTQSLHAGDIVYLQSKKKQAEKGLEKYIVENDGESLRDICQRFAVKKSSIEKINGFDPGHTLRAGDTVRLRK